jgi:hypothetical protein
MVGEEQVRLHLCLLAISDTAPAISGACWCVAVALDVPVSPGLSCQVIPLSCAQAQPFYSLRNTQAACLVTAVLCRLQPGLMLHTG